MMAEQDYFLKKPSLLNVSAMSSEDELTTRLTRECHCKRESLLMEKHLQLIHRHPEMACFYEALLECDIQLLFSLDESGSQEAVNEILTSFCAKRDHPEHKPRSSVSFENQYNQFIQRFQHDLRTICIKDSFLLHFVELKGNEVEWSELSQTIYSICMGDDALSERRALLGVLSERVRNDKTGQLYNQLVSSYLVYFLELLLARYCNSLANPHMKEVHVHLHCLPPQQDLHLLFPLIELLMPPQRLPLQTAQILFVEKTNLLVNLSRVSYLLMLNAVHSRNLISKRITGKTFQGNLSTWTHRATAQLFDKSLGFNIERIHFVFQAFDLILYEEETNLNESILEEETTKAVLEEVPNERKGGVVDYDDDVNVRDGSVEVEPISVIGFKYLLGYTEANANTLLSDIGRQVQQVIDDWSMEDGKISISEGDIVGFKSIGKCMDRQTLYLYPTLRGQVLAIVNEIAMLWVLDIGALSYVSTNELHPLNGPLASRPPLVSFLNLAGKVCAFDEVFLHRNLLFIHQILESNIQVGKQFLMDENGILILNFIEYPSLEIRIEFLTVLFLLTKHCPQVRKFLASDNFEKKIIYRLKYYTFAFRNDLVRNRGGMRREIELLSAILLHLIKDAEAIAALPSYITENAPLVFGILAEESKQNESWSRLNNEFLNQLHSRMSPKINANSTNRREMGRSNWRNDCRDKKNTDAVADTGFSRGPNMKNNHNWRDRSKDHFLNRGDSNMQGKRPMAGIFRSINQDLENNMNNLSIAKEKINCKDDVKKEVDMKYSQHGNFEEKSPFMKCLGDGDGDAPSGMKSETNLSGHYEWSCSAPDNAAIPGERPSCSDVESDKIATSLDSIPSDLTSSESSLKYFDVPGEESDRGQKEEIKQEIDHFIKNLPFNDDAHQNLTRLSYKTDFYIYGSKIEERTDEHNELYQVKRLSEVKESNLAQIICGFLNSGSGGNIFFGINMDSIIEGLYLKREDRDAFRNGVDRIMNRCLFPEVKPSFYNITFTPVVHSNRKVSDIEKIYNYVVKITAFPMLHVVYVVYQGHYCFVREGTVNKQYTAQQRRLLVMKQEEALIAENMRNLKNKIDDDLEQVAKFVHEFLPHLKKL